MRVLQVCNMISHHQLPLARSLASSVGTANFRFAALQPTGDELLKIGYQKDEQDSWILRVSENEGHRSEFERWWKEADVVICGERRVDPFKQRLNDGKLTFYMSERWWKPPIGTARLLSPTFLRLVSAFRQLAASPSFHFLPTGEYSAHDMKRIAPFGGRMWNWGYFTAAPDPLPSCEKNGQGFRVLWAGRMLRWKRVDTLIRAFSALLADRPDATLTLVGEGPERKRLEELGEKMLAKRSYSFRPPMPAPEIPKLMRQCHVYVFPSTGYEGWGAVVNEAMGGGCTVLASEATGAGKAMIRHGVNGLLFAPGDTKRLGELLSEVSINESLRIRLAQEAQRTISQCWSPAIAAERILAVSNALLAKQPVPKFHHGPMAPVWT